MENFFLVLAMKRSAHHAVINWLAKSLGDATHKNNAIDAWEKYRFEVPEGAGGRITKYGDNPERNLIVNIEDFDADDYSKFAMDSFEEVELCKNFYVITVTRDFENWVASCLKRREDSGCYRDVYYNLTNDHLNDRKEKKPPNVYLYEKLQDEDAYWRRGEYDSVVDINFDKWLTCPLVRDKLAKKFGFTSNEESLSEMSTFGKGSSFGRSTGQLTRYQEFENDSEFNEIIEKYESMLGSQLQ